MSTKESPLDIVVEPLTQHGHAAGGSVRTDQGGELAVPSCEVRRLRRRSRPRLIWAAREQAILSSDAEWNRS